jgi:hypothetical protein
MTADEIINLSSHVEEGGSKPIVFVDEFDRPCQVLDYTANGVVKIVLRTSAVFPPAEVVHVPGERIVGQYYQGPMSGRG